MFKEKIKNELTKEVYADIDRIYDFMEQRFVLSNEHEQLTIKQLNRLKDQLYLIIKESPLT